MENAHIEPRVRKLEEPLDATEGQLLLILNEPALSVEALRPFARAMGREVS